MSRCVDCYWFNNPPKAGRESKTCSDLGELAQNKACDNFTPRPVDEELKAAVPDLTPEGVSSFVGALAHQSYRDIFKEVLSEGFVLEQDVELAMKDVQYQLQTQGANIEVDTGEYSRVASKLADLYMTYRMILAMGLAPYRQEIMSMAIQRKFRMPEDKS